MIKNIGNKEDYIPIQKLSENRYLIMFNLEDQGSYYSGMEEELKYKPTLNSIKNLVLKEINKDIDNKILSGFVGKDMPIWLSTENQFNYQSAYYLAVTVGGNLPCVFKFGSNEEPIYYTFETLEDLQDFYISALAYIQKTLSEGGAKKDNIDGTMYNIE